MLFDVWIFAPGLVERVVEQNLALRGSLFDGSRFVVGYKLVVDELKNANLTDLTVDSLAVWTGLSLTALLIYLFANLGSSKVVYVRSPELVEELSSIRFFE